MIPRQPFTYDENSEAEVKALIDEVWRSISCDKAFAEIFEKSRIEILAGRKATSDGLLLEINEAASLYPEFDRNRNLAKEAAAELRRRGVTIPPPQGETP